MCCSMSDLTGGLNDAWKAVSSPILDNPTLSTLSKGALALVPVVGAPLAAAWTLSDQIQAANDASDQQKDAESKLNAYNTATNRYASASTDLERIANQQRDAKVGGIAKGLGIAVIGGFLLSIMGVF